MLFSKYTTVILILAFIISDGSKLDDILADSCIIDLPFPAVVVETNSSISSSHNSKSSANSASGVFCRNVSGHSGIVTCSGQDNIPRGLPNNTWCLIMTYNAIRILNAAELEYLKNLKVLILDNCPLSQLNGNFSDLRLEYLSIKYTGYESVPDIRLPRLRRLDMAQSYLRKIGVKDLSRISSQIQIVRLIGCWIYEIENGTFGSLLNLYYLDLSGNNLTRVPKDIPNTLVALNMLNNINMSVLDVHSSPFLPYLKEIAISATTVKANAFRNFFFASNVLLQACYIETLAMADLQFVFQFRIIPSCLYLNLQEGAFAMMNPLQNFSFSGNLPTVPSFIFHGCNNLEMIKLDTVYILHLNSSAFKGLPSLHTLVMTNNFGQYVHTLNITDVFLNSDLRLLKFLDMSNFGIRAIEKTAFLELVNVQNLNISSNHIESLSADVIQPMGNLRSFQM
ncbi:hypothetical protein CHS0354_028931 [Potamilus streckersoni]|uniref:Uncharacterized protein n=1 Tax=Potamilus streckersoni TaxID=2493646 RepID=A0AAE0SIZ3_9BIVA|nr:hypothetical protein CHS0354_028931 [Potamilus streckersoni]